MFKSPVAKAVKDCNRTATVSDRNRGCSLGDFSAMQLQLPHLRGHLQNHQKTGQDWFLGQTKHRYNVGYISINSTTTRLI